MFYKLFNLISIYGSVSGNGASASASASAHAIANASVKKWNARTWTKFRIILEFDFHGLDQPRFMIRIGFFP